MGDDNEIRQIVRRESEHLVDEARKATRGVGPIYNLEEEFAKTRKNKSIIVVGVTLLTIAALGAAAFFTTSLIQRQTAATPVDVKAFQDLNLKDLLDRAKRDASDLEQAKVELTRIQTEQQGSLDAIERDRLSSIESIKARGLPRAEEQRRLLEAGNSAERQKKAVRDRYTAPIAGKAAEVKAVQDKVDSYDQRLSDQTRKQQELLDNQNRLFNIEKQRLVKTYAGQIQDLKDSIKRAETALKRQREELASSLTSRWNPTWEDARSVSLLGNFKDDANKSVPTGALPAGLFADAAMTRDELAAAEASLANILFLSSQLQAVPYLNSVPPALARMEAEARREFTILRAALGKAGGALEDRDTRIAALETKLASTEAMLAATESSLDRYRYATHQYVLDNREGGYIIDPRNSSDILVALNPAVPVVDGTTGYVVRPGNKAIATIAFSVSKGQTRARILQIEKGEQLKAFDPIIVFVAAAAPDAGH